MTHYIQRTVTITIVETLTMLWCYTNHDEPTPALDTLSVAAPLLACSISRVTSTVNQTLLPAHREEAPNES